MEQHIFLLLQSCFTIILCAKFYPTVQPDLRIYKDENKAKPLFRSILLDPDGTNFYAAGSAVYKFKVSDSQAAAAEKKTSLSNIMDNKPNFNDRSTVRSWWTATTKADAELRKYKPLISVFEQVSPNFALDDFNDASLYPKLTKYLHNAPVRNTFSLRGNQILDTIQQYSSIYQSADSSFREHCLRQADSLKLYYHNGLQMAVTDPASLCDVHFRGLAFLGDGKLFSVKNGIFGTMPISATGTNLYSAWFRYEYVVTDYLNCVLEQRSCTPLFSNSPFDPNLYNGIITDPSFGPVKQFLMPSPENYIGKQRICDNTPAPNRVILQQNSLEIVKGDVLTGDSNKESCITGSLAQHFLSGYHPNQTSYTYYSGGGNGPGGDKQAVYIISEIGQEKQMDLMLEYLNLPEIYPLSSSASLSIVRLLIDGATGDIDPNTITISNPFKFTWVTSPLNRFGRLDKSSSQEQVSYLPKPVAIFEDGNFMYFFFREADWENTPVPPYNIRRSHFKLNSYSHSLFFPWEKVFLKNNYIKHEELPGKTFEELYAPSYMGWKHVNSNLKVTGRVARICKNDAGIPLGLQDPNLFDLDNKLSLTTFQTFLKSRLTCKVPVAGVPFVWRLRKDESRMNDTGDCLTQVEKAENLYSKDIHYRQVGRDEYVTRKIGTEQAPVLKYYYLSHCKGYKWSYVPKPVTSTAVYVEYTELRDVVKIDNDYYGVFSLPFASEQSHSDSSRQNTGVSPLYASALCAFTKDDIAAAFNGPFKRKDSVSGGYRPFDPRLEGEKISPSPYECGAEPINSNAKNMTVEFLDPTQPYEEETRFFDFRKVSSRVKFFEEDIYGSRTMWNDVGVTSVLAENGIVFDKIAAETIEDKKFIILYVATMDGQIYKIAVWNGNQVCQTTSEAAYTKWLNSTKSMSSIWDNEVYAYLNRTLDKTTFAASFKSDLTMEKNTRFPVDMLLRSDWDCSPKYEANVVAVFTPFGAQKKKIWDMKLSRNKLLLATDESVLQVNTLNCSMHTNCKTCSRDPHCGWNTGKGGCGTYRAGLLRSVEKISSDCSCESKNITAHVNTPLVLSGLTFQTDLSDVQWYLNGTKVTYIPTEIMLSHDTSLIIMRVLAGRTGEYELRHETNNECLLKYQVSLSDCSNLICQYEMQYKEWCAQYNQFLSKMTQWERDYENAGFCTNV